MFVNSTVSSYTASLTQTWKTRQQDATSSFSLEANITVSVAGEVEGPRERTVDDVKKEFYDYLGSLNITSPGLDGTAVDVTISDKAFEKMLNDPKYEQKMKDLCARDLCDPAWNSMPFGIQKLHVTIDDSGEYTCTSYNEGYQGSGLNDDPDAFWSRRSAKKKENDEIASEAAQKRKEMLDFLLERADARKRSNRDGVTTDYSGMVGGAFSSMYAGGSTAGSIMDVLAG